MSGGAVVYRRRWTQEGVALLRRLAVLDLEWAVRARILSRVLRLHGEDALSADEVSAAWVDVSEGRWPTERMGET